MVSGFMVSGFIQIGIEIAIGIDCCDHSVARNDECKSGGVTVAGRLACAAWRSTAWSQQERLTRDPRLAASPAPPKKTSCPSCEKNRAMHETRNLEAQKPKVTRLIVCPARAPRHRHRISKRLRAITSMPPTTPKRLSCPLP